MITGSFTNADGGVHPAAVALATKMQVDLLKKVNNVTVQVYHDAATAQAAANPAKGQAPRAISVKNYPLKGAAFTTDTKAVDVFLVGQPGFAGWTEVAGS
jgi:hypothetical protein